MLRRIVCLLLVPALLASQTEMCFAHVHIGSEAEDHAARPHVHLSNHSHGHHSHAHRSHHHDDHRGECEHSVELQSLDANSKLTFGTSCPTDHDSDAVYFGEQDTILHHFGKITFERSSDRSSDCSLVFVPRMAKPGFRGQLRQAGPFLPYACAIFLQTRCLLI